MLTPRHITLEDLHLAQSPSGLLNLFGRLGYTVEQEAIPLHKQEIGFAPADLATIKRLFLLADEGGKIFMGVKTGLNDAFVIDESTRQKLIDSDPKSAELIKPWLRGRDIRRWNLDWANLYIIFLCHGVEIGKYPAIQAHLENFRKDLEVRATSSNHPWGMNFSSHKWAFTNFLTSPK